MFGLFSVAGGFVLGLAIAYLWRLRGQARELERARSMRLRSELRRIDRVLPLECDFEYISEGSVNDGYLISYCGRFRFRCDMSRAVVVISEKPGCRVDVTLPEPSIEKGDIAIESFAVHDEKEGFWLKQSLGNTLSAALDSEKARIRRKYADEMGILERAKESARRNVTAFIEAMGMEARVSFVTEEELANIERTSQSLAQMAAGAGSPELDIVSKALRAASYSLFTINTK